MAGTPDSRAEVVNRLRAAGCVFAEDEADMILAAAESGADLDSMVADRVAGIPLEHILGSAEFCGLRVLVGPGVFIPRPRTEHLAAAAIVLARAGERPVVVDMCCGSGAIAASIAAAVDRAELYATDVDPAAVAYARRNLAAPARVFEGDLFDALPGDLRGRVDVLVANVPYVPSADIGMMPREARLHEARVALDGGADGLDVLRRVAAAAPRWLAAGGSLLVEISERQAPLAVEAFAAAGLDAGISRDDELDATVVIGRRPGVAAG